MEAQTARRRINTIAAHFAPIDDVSATHVLPMNCSSSLNSVARRDNKMHFARRASASQARFMRQASIKEVTANESFYNTSEAPLFSQPSRIGPNLPTAEMIQNLAQGSILTAPEPKFARSSRTVSGEKHLYAKKKVHSSEPNGIEWSPRMDIAESECNYVITVEIPGVNIKDIRVEIDDQKEISQGPYEVAWPLPPNVNKDNVSADFFIGGQGILIIRSANDIIPINDVHHLEHVLMYTKSTVINYSSWFQSSSSVVPVAVKISLIRGPNNMKTQFLGAAMGDCKLVAPILSISIISRYSKSQKVENGGRVPVLEICIADVKQLPLVYFFSKDHITALRKISPMVSNEICSETSAAEVEGYGASKLTVDSAVKYLQLANKLFSQGILELVIPVYKSRRPYGQLSKCHTILTNVYESILEQESSPIPFTDVTYYRRGWVLGRGGLGVAQVVPPHRRARHLHNGVSGGVSSSVSPFNVAPEFDSC
ncbi:alpha-crystallin domain 32.1 protein [Prunus dulcis]|uniref:Alpha-crystallin domain 32.1 protein n=1 Tax=Prunus dulcis TaxID=3755 RepID=A0A4Y1R5A9_PRUDU|nr:alpha-crystallin domain 32.1 protein [Prunus dulcis]